MASIYRNLYEEEDSALLDPRTAAMKRRAATLRTPTSAFPPEPVGAPDEENVEAAPDDEALEYVDAGALPESAGAAPSADVPAVLHAGMEDPARASERAYATARANMLLNEEAPKGQMLGQVYLAPTPISSLLYGARQATGLRALKKATAPSPDTRGPGAEAAMRLTGEEQIRALLMSADPGLQKAGAALLQQRRAEEAAAASREALRTRAVQQIDLESARQGGREALAKLRATLKPPAAGPRPFYTVSIGPDGRAYRVDRATGSISRVDLPPAGPPPGAEPGSREAKDAEALALDRLPADVRTKYSVYDWQTKNVPTIITQVQNAPPDTFGPGTDMASFIPGESFSAAVRTWQDAKRTPEQIAARRAVFSDAYTKIKELAGTAMTQTESNRLREFLPNGNDTPEAIVAKLRGAYEESTRQRQNVRSQYLSAFPEAPTGAAGSAPAPAPAGNTQIRVRAKTGEYKGQIGRIPADEFDPALYERVP